MFSSPLDTGRTNRMVTLVHLPERLPQNLVNFIAVLKFEPSVPEDIMINDLESKAASDVVCQVMRPSKEF